MFFKNNGTDIALVFCKWVCFCYCSSSLLLQIKGISILFFFFQKYLQNLLQQIIADIPPMPYLMDGQFLLFCSLCHMIIFLITQEPKTYWAVEQNDAWSLVSLRTRQKSSLGQISERIKLRDVAILSSGRSLAFKFRFFLVFLHCAADSKATPRGVKLTPNLQCISCEIIVFDSLKIKFAKSERLNGMWAPPSNIRSWRASKLASDHFYSLRQL